MKMGNTVGSIGTNFCDFKKSNNTAYVLGLWCADGYHRTSSIGLSNIQVPLITVFRDFLYKILPKNRVKLRLYVPDKDSRAKSKIHSLIKRVGVRNSVVCSVEKARNISMHLYVNCRPLFREFYSAKRNLLSLVNKNNVSAYFAGRFDGDGSISADCRSDCRIVYTTREEAETDSILIKMMRIKKSKIYCYKKARTFCLYVSRLEADVFVRKIREFTRTQKLVSIPSRD